MRSTQSDQASAAAALAPAAGPVPDPAWVAPALARLQAAGERPLPLVWERRAGGGATHGWWCGARDPRAVVVYAHGTGNDALFPQVDLTARLVQKGISVLLFDLDGHGRNSTTRLAPGHLGSAFADAVAMIPRAAAGLPILAAGQSLGGLLALDYAIGNESLAGVVALSVPLSLDAGVRALAREAAGMVRPAVLRQIALYGPLGIWPALGAFKRAVYPVRLADRSTSGATAYVRTVRGIIAGIAPRLTAAAPSCPALLIYGGGDHIAPAGHGRRLCSAWPAAAWLLVKGATHFSLPFEPAVADSILNFVRSAAGREQRRIDAH